MKVWIPVRVASGPGWLSPQRTCFLSRSLRTIIVVKKNVTDPQPLERFYGFLKVREGSGFFFLSSPPPEGVTPRKNATVEDHIGLMTSHLFDANFFLCTALTCSQFFVDLPLWTLPSSYEHD